MTTPEERMWKLEDENGDQFVDKSFHDIILLHRIHEHETTKTLMIDKFKRNIIQEKGGPTWP